jgi:dephospho-CoA kinase
MLRVALTGGIGTGKSYVLARLRDAGVPVIDADVLAREAVATGSQGLAAVVSRFGRDVLSGDGSLDRARLAQIVFADKTARRDLEAIVHPYVRRRIDDFFLTLPDDVPFAVADIPLLYEAGRQRQFDRVVVVACAPDTQIARIMKRDRLSRQEADRRVAAQLPIDAKVALADDVIRTDGSYEETNAQVQQLVTRLRAEKGV